MGEFKDINKPIQRIKSSLPEPAQSFIDKSLLERAPKTVYEYCKNLRLFYDYLSKITSTDVMDIDINVLKGISADNLKNFQDYISDGNNSFDKDRYNVPVGKLAVSKRTTCLSKYFSFLKSSGLIDHNPVKDLLTYKPSKKEYDGRFIKEDELQALLAAIKEAKSTSFHSRLAALLTVKRDIAIVLLLHNTGLSPKECVNLNFSDLDLDNSTVMVKRNGREVLISIDEQVKTALKDYIENERPTLTRGADVPALLISLKGGRMYFASIGYMLGRYGKNIGMPKSLCPTKLYGEKKYEFYAE